MTRLRLGLALVGFGLALVGIVFDNTDVVWTALVVLLASTVIRLVQRKRERLPRPSDPEV